LNGFTPNKFQSISQALVAAWWLSIPQALVASYQKPGGFPWWLAHLVASQFFHVHLVQEMIPWREALRVRVAEAWRKLRGKVLGQYCSRKPEADACIAVPPHGSSSGRVFFKCPMSIKFLKMFKEKYIAHLHPKPRAAFTRISGAIYSQKIRARRQTQVAVP